MSSWTDWEEEGVDRRVPSEMRILLREALSDVGASVTIYSSKDIKVEEKGIFSLFIATERLMIELEIAAIIDLVDPFFWTAKERNSIIFSRCVSTVLIISSLSNELQITHKVDKVSGVLYQTMKI